VQAPGFEFHTGVSYRNLLVFRGEKVGHDVQDFGQLKTNPPHEIPNEPAAGYVPSGPGSDILRSIMTQSKRMFDVHEVNKGRVAKGQNPATQVWLWGQGKAPSLKTFVDRFGVKAGCMITGVDLLRGIARLLGWQVQEVDGMTSFHDTNYAGQGTVTADMLDKYDIVVSHVEAPDEASHQADVKTKVASIEAIDRHVVGPVLEKLRTFPEWRLLVMPDHPTNIRTRKHGRDPSPFCIAGSNVAATTRQPYGERAAAASGLMLDKGHELMEFFLRG
jgi:2,3-bisphosphoglycerate-independent phosphoglycerate mutase